MSRPIRSIRYLTATQVAQSTQARHTCVAQFVGLVATDGTCELYLMVGFIVGCADLGAPYQTVCTCLTVGAVIGRPRSAESLRNSYLLTPTSCLAEALHSDCTTSQGFHPGISESLPETPYRIVLPLRRLRRARTADRTRSTAVLRPYQRALRWKR